MEDSVMCRGEGLFLLLPVAGPQDSDVSHRSPFVLQSSRPCLRVDGM